MHLVICLGFSSLLPASEPTESGKEDVESVESLIATAMNLGYGTGDIATILQAARTITG